MFAAEKMCLVPGTQLFGQPADHRMLLVGRWVRCLFECMSGADVDRLPGGLQGLCPTSRVRSHSILSSYDDSVCSDQTACNARGACTLSATSLRLFLDTRLTYTNVNTWSFSNVVSTPLPQGRSLIVLMLPVKQPPWIAMPYPLPWERTGKIGSSSTQRPRWLRQLSLESRLLSAIPCPAFFHGQHRWTTTTNQSCIPPFRS